MTTVDPIRSINDIEKIKSYLLKINKRDFMIFLIGINTGLRVSDILKLNVKDVYNKTYIEIQEQKTNKLKKFPLNKILQKSLNEYVKTLNYEQKPLFIGKKGYRLNRSTVYRFIKKACNDCKINVHVGTHTMRKTFGYHHYKKFNNVVLLQKILNHSTPFITLTYIGISQDEIDYTYINFEL